MKNEIKKVIHKYHLTEQVNRVEMPANAEILFVENQQNCPTIWYLWVAGNSDPDVSRWFYVYGTGAPIPMRAKYVGSCICSPFVWHVFEDSP